MDTKNVIAAISLSAAVIILYSLFFAPSPNELKKIDEQKSSMSSEAPKLEESEKIVELSRDQALKESNRVEFENQNIKGSISLMGGTIDDLIFKNYTEKVWGIDCKDIGADWAAQRIKGLSLSTAIKFALFPNSKKRPKTLVDKFYYPRPFPSWTLDSDDNWTPPLAKPKGHYYWDETVYQGDNTKGWVEDKLS